MSEKELENLENCEEEKHTESKSKKKEKKKETLEDKLETIQEELKNVKDKYLRSLAEQENFQKRMTEDLKRERKYASYTLADKLIDSIEVFDQALNVKTDDPNFKNFLYGFKMIKDMFYNALTDEGVTLIDTKIGDQFDPVLEHAVDTSFEEGIPNNTILKVIKKGYKFKDRLLRPAMVVINIKPEIQEEIETPTIEINTDEIVQ